MTKITFLGAGSSVFAKNVLGDAMMCEALEDSHIALHDIDSVRLDDSKRMLDNINKNHKNAATITAHLDRREALENADFAVNAIQVGGYDPSTIIDFEIPKKYGLRQTIADTLGIGGIFRALRTIPVMWDFAKDIEQLCPDIYLLNYTNPMSMLTGAMLRHTKVKTVGLCHSVQVCAKSLMETVGMEYDESVVQKIAGINHMGWLLEIKKDGVDLYPEIKERAEKLDKDCTNLVRIEMMKRFGYYVTESSEHNAEYLPYFIKDKYPELIEKFNIPLDEYPHRCINQIEKWKKLREDLVNNTELDHTRSHEYASYIMEAIVTNKPYEIGGNVLNNGLIPNLPHNCTVEVPCLVNATGIQGTYIGDLPEQLAALNRTNINVHLITIEAAKTLKKDYIYQAAMLDPHTSSELSIDDIVSLCDDLIEAHSSYLPEYK